MQMRSEWDQVVAILVAIVVVGVASAIVSLSIRRTRQKLRKAAEFAASRAKQKKLGELSRDSEFLRACAKLAGKPVEKRLAAYIALEVDGRLVEYLPAGPVRMKAAQIVSLLTDLPSRWIYDVVTGRRS